MRMDYKKANVAFFFMVLSTFVIMVYISFWQAFTGRAHSLPANNALCELMILIPDKKQTAKTVCIWAPLNI